MRLTSARRRAKKTWIAFSRGSGHGCSRFRRSATCNRKQGNHVDAEEFRKHGHEVVDWIADYLGGVRGYPVLPNVKPGQLTSELPASGPETGEPMDRIL